MKRSPLNDFQKVHPSCKQGHKYLMDVLESPIPTGSWILVMACERCGDVFTEHVNPEGEEK